MRYQNLNEKEAFKEIVQTTQDALSTTDFKKYYEEEEKIKYISMEKLKNYFKNNEYKEKDKPG